MLLSASYASGTPFISSAVTSGASLSSRASSIAQIVSTSSGAGAAAGAYGEAQAITPARASTSAAMASSIRNLIKRSAFPKKHHSPSAFTQAFIISKRADAKPTIS